MEQKKQIAYLQWLRLLAAAAVVLMHTEGTLWPAGIPGSREFGELTAWDSLVRWPVPVFVMITGALFLPRKTALSTVLKRYIPRMAAAFFFWSGVYLLWTWSQGDRTALLQRFVTGHYHLWYLPFVCGLYLTIPFLQKIVTDEDLGRKLLAVSLVVGGIIPWVGDLTALCFPALGGVVGSLKNSLHYTFFFDLLAVVLLGYRLSRREFTAGQRRVIYAAGILGAVLTLPLTLWASGRTGGPNALFCQHSAPTTLAAAAAVFVFARYHLTRLPGWVQWMAERSFGVYLSHVLVLEVLEKLGIHALAADPVWTVPVIGAGAFLLSLGLTELLRRVPHLGNKLV